MAITAMKTCKAIMHPLLKRHIDEFGKIIYGTNSDIFTISENGDRCQ